MYIRSGFLYQINGQSNESALKDSPLISHFQVTIWSNSTKLFVNNNTHPNCFTIGVEGKLVSERIIFNTSSIALFFHKIGLKSENKVRIMMICVIKYTLFRHFFRTSNFDTLAFLSQNVETNYMLFESPNIAVHLFRNTVSRRFRSVF